MIASMSQILAFILENELPRLNRMGIDPKNIPENFDLIGSGLMDSMGFIEVLDKVEQKYGIELDFEDMDPTQFTAVHNLSVLILNLLK